MKTSAQSNASPAQAQMGRAQLALHLVEQARQPLAILEGAHPAGAKVLLVNSAFERLTGVSSAQAAGRTLLEFLAPAPPPEAWLWGEAATQPGQIRQVVPCRKTDGTEYSVDLHLYPLGDGQPTGFWGASLTDLTDQLELHEALWQDEHTHHLLAEHARELITLWGQDGRCIFASPAASSVLGLAPRSLLGHSLPELLHPDELFSLTTAFAGQFDRPRAGIHVHRLRRANGTYVWVETVSRIRPSTTDAGRASIVLNSRDITKRRAAEQSLEHVHSLLSSIYDAVPIGLCLIDPSGVITQSNRAFCQLFQLPLQSPTGHPANEYLPERVLTRATQAKGVPVECECVDGEGHTFPAELHVVPLEDNQGRLVMLTDLRDRRRILEQLQDARRLESLGTLAGGIAHDFNNMLAIILSYASMLTDAAEDPLRLEHYAATIIDAGRRGAEVVRQLQLFANTQNADAVPTDIHALLDEVMAQAKHNWPADITLEHRFDAEDPTLVVDPLQFALALEKLLDNAKSATPPGGQVVVRTTEVRQSTFAPGVATPESRIYLRITIQDSGKGMDAATRERMFDPFFAKHKGAEARGLGLAVVYGIVRAHRGMIEVESMVGQGTSVHLLMPRAPLVAPQPEEPAVSEPPSSKRTILLVEDEEDLGALWNDLLPNQGWRTLWAKDGEEALRLFAAHKDEIALVFSDIGLPGIDGWQVVAHIRSERPDIPLLLTSGAFGNNERKKEIAAPVAYLPKPYVHTKALGEIKHLLSGKR
ncbi:MAG: PAS domain S-box protein [Opitutaceae bacterium]|nr:PAS domain S-box protein [Opitutaceae bacterium]